jgi:hypothetical protein
MGSKADDYAMRRLEALEEQAALHGPLTEPAILIEIADLRNKRPTVRPLQRGGYVNELDFDLVRSTVAAALVRLGVIEKNQEKDQQSRSIRQLIHDIWMIVITIMVFASLLLAIYNR